MSYPFLVPAPKAGEQDLFLTPQKAWAEPSKSDLFLASTGAWLNGDETHYFLKGDGTWSQMELTVPIPTRDELQAYTWDQLAELSDEIVDKIADRSFARQDYYHLLNARFKNPDARLVAFCGDIAIDGVTADDGDFVYAGMIFQATRYPASNEFLMSVTGSNYANSNIKTADETFITRYLGGINHLLVPLRIAYVQSATNLNVSQVTMRAFSPSYCQFWDSNQYGYDGERFDICAHCTDGLTANEIRTLPNYTGTGTQQWITRSPSTSGDGWRAVTATGGATNNCNGSTVFPCFSVSHKYN